uniref:Uncharacterized protein n=1 Tax=Nelumbo nucifera TaxID=4432 RepID=A0A822YV98_NELNU|nr:TPA_asm: hypothetical protein HUJ06_005969 [Nelumbo nucifera]
MLMSLLSHNFTYHKQGKTRKNEREMK